jgi:hypothetical protein
MRDDTFGSLVALTLAGMIALFAYAITMWAMDATAKRNAYEQCVATIPGYLDAQEILYTEQECHHG